MPAFSFEKLSPPVQPVSSPEPAKKQRGGIAQILGRFVERRGKRVAKNVAKSDRSASAQPKTKP